MTILLGVLLAAAATDPQAAPIERANVLMPANAVEGDVFVAGPPGSERPTRRRFDAEALEAAKAAMRSGRRVSIPLPDPVATAR